MKKKLGILAFQGGVGEHKKKFNELEIQVKWIKQKSDLEGITHLVIPGGESSVIGQFLQSSGLDQAIQKKYANNQLNIWGTCAGAILLAKKGSPYCLNLIDIEIERNAYGKQIHSFIESIFLPELKDEIEAIFIRAPIIKKVEREVKVLGTHNSSPIICRNDQILISTFHPELSDSVLVHKYFLEKFS